MQLVLRFLFQLVEGRNPGRDRFSRLLRDADNDKPVGQRRILQQIRQLLIVVAAAGRGAAAGRRRSYQGRPEGQLLREVLD